MEAYDSFNVLVAEYPEHYAPETGCQFYIEGGNNGKWKCVSYFCTDNLPSVAKEIVKYKKRAAQLKIYSREASAKKLGVVEIGTIIDKETCIPVIKRTLTNDEMRTLVASVTKALRGK